MKITYCNRLPISLVVLILVGVLILFACASSRETLSPAERVVLGVLLETTDGTPWGREGAALVEKARAAGFEVLVRTANGGGWEVRKDQVRELIKAGASLLVAVPSTSEATDSPPDRLHPLPVPVIACGELIPGLDAALLVGPDLEAAGYLQARTIRERIPGRGVVLLGGPEDNPEASRLRAGQLRAFAEWEELRGEETGLAADLRLADPSAREARLRAAEELARPVRTREAISAIVAFDDAAAGGAAAAVGAENLAGWILLAGRGGELAACRRIIEGSQLLTIYTPPETLAAATVRAAIRLARGMDPGEVAESLGWEPRLLDNGERKVPAVLLPPVLVTRATMVETVILDGIYPIEAVYGPAAPE